jgi:hypothetical protein
VETWEWIAVGAAGAAGAILLFALVATLITARRRRSHLQKRFGPEYYHAVSASGKRRAERRLANVEDEHKELHIRGLPWVTLERYLEEWRQAEARFVSDPADSTRAAERIVTRVLEERGYPVDGDSEEIAAHIGADYPDVANRYRHGRTILEPANVEGKTTEDLRHAMLDFRAVLEELLVREPTPTQEKAEVA